MTRRRHPTITHRIGLHSALSRYGFTALALLAFTNNLLLPTAVSGALAIYAWKKR